MIQHAFSKSSLVILISKDAKTWYSFYQFTQCFSLQTSYYDVIFDFCNIKSTRQGFEKAC